MLYCDLSDEMQNTNFEITDIGIRLFSDVICDIISLTAFTTLRYHKLVFKCFCHFEYEAASSEVSVGD